MAGIKTLILGITTLLLQCEVSNGTLRYADQTGPVYERDPNDPAFITECVYDEAKDLICHFEVTPGAGPLDLWYSFPGLSRGYPCPLQSDSNCTWPNDSPDSGKMPKPTQTYVLAFMDRTTNKWVSRSVFMTPLDEIKPSKVQQVENRPTNTTLSLSWEAPQLGSHIPRLAFLYKIQLFHAQEEVRAENTTEMSFTFHDLIPNEVYTAEIRSCSLRPNSSVHWSDPEKVTVKTDPGLATINPEIAGYHWVDSSHIQVLWKPLSLAESRGPNLFYELVIHDNTTQSKDTTTDFFMTTKLEEEESYTFEVYASHSYGRNASLPSSLLEISWPRKEIISQLSPVAYNGGNVAFYWPPGVNVTSYNLLWCEGGETWQSCKNDVNWRQISESDTGKPLQLGLASEATYNFAISANFPSEEQGPLTWSTCTYEQYKALKKPKQPFRSSRMKAKELHIEWNLPLCRETGYIQNYILHLCLSSDCDNTEEQVELATTVHEWRSSDVQPGKTYEVWLEALSPLTESVASDRLSVTVKDTGLSGGSIAAIVICSVVLLLLIFWVVFEFKRRYKHHMKELKITVPEREKVCNFPLDDNLSYDYTGPTEQVYRPESRNSDNSSNARREGFESRTSENIRNEYQENNLQNGYRKTDYI